MSKGTTKSTLLSTDWIQRVIDFVKGGDEGKLTRFKKNTLKFWDKQIKANQGEMEKLDDKITDKREVIDDLKEKLDETVLSIDLEKIKTTEQTELYIKEYTESIRSVERSIENVESEITDLEAQKGKCETQIAHFTRLSGYLN